MKKETKLSYEESINKATAFIEDNISDNIRLKDVALEANISQYHFHRIFKSFTGNTTREFLTRIRVEKAAVKLKHSNEPIGEIAINCGYQNHETFTRAFKDYFGVTPIQYRERTLDIIAQKQNEYVSANIDLNVLNISEPIIKVLPSMPLAYIRHYGAYEKVGKSFQQLMLWALTHLVLKLKPITIGIVHDNPDITAEDQIRFDACVVLSKEIKPNGQIGYKKIEGGKFAVFTYKGPYDGFYPVYDYIYNVCLFQKQYILDDRPAFEWYIKSPPYYKPKHYVTDFYIPIK